MEQLEFTGTKYEQIQARLKERNERFSKLTKDEQRVAIAQDVIAQLDAKKIQAASTYFDTSNPAAFSAISTAGYDRELAECTSQIKCQVCGIGSLFVAAVEFADKLTTHDFLEGDLDIDDLQVEYLAEWFDEDQLRLVEDYFEAYGNKADWDSLESSIQFEDNAETRMRMIMENIIANGGRFDPNNGPHADVPEEA